jgi:hypothetical protein
MFGRAQKASVPVAPARPRLDLSGPRLRRARRVAGRGRRHARRHRALHGCAQAQVRGVPRGAGRRRAGPGASTSSLPSAVRVHAHGAPPHRPWLEEPVFDAARGARDCSTQPRTTSSTDARITQFCAVFPQDDRHRWVRDLAAEVLHNVDPERFPLMTRWVWDREANTGVLREIWYDDGHRPHDHRRCRTATRPSWCCARRSRSSCPQRRVPRRGADTSTCSARRSTRTTSASRAALPACRFLGARGPDAAHAPPARTGRRPRRGRARTIRGDRRQGPARPSPASPPRTSNDEAHAHTRAIADPAPENLHVHDQLEIDGVDVSGHWSTFIQSARGHRLQRGARGRDRGACRAASTSTAAGSAAPARIPAPSTRSTRTSTRATGST